MNIFACELVSRTSNQVSSNLGPLWQPGVYNDTNSFLALSQGKAAQFVRTRGLSKHTRFSNTENSVNPLCLYMDVVKTLSIRAWNPERVSERVSRPALVWAAANGGVTNGGLRGVWPPFPEIGRNRPFSPFFCLFRPFPEGLKSTWKIQKTEEKGLFPQIFSDFLKPPSLKPPFAALQLGPSGSRVQKVSECFETPEIFVRLFWTLFGPRVRTAAGDSFEALREFRARRAQETPVSGGRCPRPSIDN